MYRLTSGQSISNNSIVITLEKDVITDTNCLDLSCESLIIERLNKETNVFALFPLGGTETSVTLYLLKDYLEFIKSPQELDYASKRHDRKVILDGQPLTVNMTELENGEYLAYYISCGSHGLVKLTLKTKE